MSFSNTHWRDLLHFIDHQDSGRYLGGVFYMSIYVHYSLQNSDSIFTDIPGKCFLFEKNHS